MEKLEILFENDEMLAINKPAGISVHHDGKTEEQVVTDFLIEKYPEIKNVGESILLENGIEVERPGIVHRLDKETSGVLLIAKTNEAFQNLKDQFKNHQIQKTYVAFVYGNIKEERGVISKPIGRSKEGVRKWATGSDIRGVSREAKTTFKVHWRSGEASLLEVWPQTGRTHQIRVHTKSIHHPVVADSLYAPAKPRLFGFSRLALHARRLNFKDVSGESHEIEAEFPADFKNAFEELQLNPKDLRL